MVNILIHLEETVVSQSATVHTFIYVYKSTLLCSLFRLHMDGDMAGISFSLHADNVFVNVQLRNGIPAKILI